MGGLDSRYLISQLKGSYTFKVKSLTTVATPHRGSAFADYMINEIIGKDRMPTLLNALKVLNVPGGGAAFEDLTRESMQKFNEEVKDDDDVMYFSWGASFKPSFFNEFRIPWGIIQAEEGEWVFWKLPRKGRGKRNLSCESSVLTIRFLLIQVKMMDWSAQLALNGETIKELSTTSLIFI